MIAATVLGVMALFALYMAFGPSLTSSKTTVAVTASPTPRPAAPANTNPDRFVMPSDEQQLFGYETTPIAYDRHSANAPDPGRNIFAFYEPPPPCTTCPTPTPPPVVIPTPTPTPTPPMLVNFVSPQSVYAGSKSFRLEVNGEKFSPEARIYFGQSEVPTRFVSEQRLVADIPESMIGSEGQRTIMVQTPDGKLYSNQGMLNVQPQPKPDFLYVGMIARKRHNNDTAYFLEQGKQAPITARLSDVVGGRFRLMSISAEETVFEDVSLGFKHRLPLHRPDPTTSSSSSAPPARRGFPREGTYVPYNPNVPNYNPQAPQQVPQQVPQPQVQTQDIPGIPNNIPRYVPPGTNQQQPQQPPRPNEQQKDEDGDGDN